MNTKHIMECLIAAPGVGPLGVGSKFVATAVARVSNFVGISTVMRSVLSKWDNSFREDENDVAADAISDQHGEGVELQDVIADDVIADKEQYDDDTDGTARLLSI